MSESEHLREPSDGAGLEHSSWPREGLERVGCCPICGDRDRVLRHEGLTDRVFFCAPGRWSLYACPTCTCAYLDPRPTAETLPLAYRSYYTHEETTKTFASAPRGYAQRIQRGLRNGYLNALYSTRLEPASWLGRWIVPLVPSRKLLLGEDVRHLPATDRPGTLADLGCGSGAYLVTATELGWEAWGLDPDPRAVEAARTTGARVFVGGFPDTGLPSGRFDVVTMNHVIEHVPDPVAALKEVARILKPGGRVWIATPNLQSFGHARFGPHWIGLDAPRHLVLFTQKSLARALERSGFTNLETKRTWVRASWYFEASLRISRGEDPSDERGAMLTPSLRMRALWANGRSVLDPAKGEAIIMTAMRPESPSGLEKNGSTGSSRNRNQPTSPGA